MATVHSSLVQLWSDDNNCILLFDAKYDKLHRKPSFNETSDEMEENVEISALMYFNNTLWIGTVDGYLMLYEVKERKSDDLQDQSAETCKMVNNCENKTKYPTGKRISPDFNLEEHTNMPYHMKNICYIPTKDEITQAEAMREDQLSKHDERAMRYSVSIEPFDKECPSNFVEQRRRRNTLFSNNVKIREDDSDSYMNPKRRQTVSSVKKYCNIKTLSSSGIGGNDEISTRPPIFNKYSPTKPSLNNSNEYDDGVSLTGLSTANPSMEFDDLFEIYSDEDANLFTDTSGLAVDYLAERTPVNKTVQIPRRKASRNPRSFDTTDLLLQSKISEASDDEDNMLNKTHLRRKDLEFEDNRKPSSIQDRNIQLELLMKLKISDESIQCIIASKVNQEDVVLTGTGKYNTSEEALLIWRQEPATKLWINDPIEDKNLRKIPMGKKSFPFTFLQNSSS
uniref:Mcl1_mid domain-containing protein n=1 Tax=Parastrongyloides trichosuri TaxID=131310 RepID=A0A0N4ZSN4_PARTI